MDEEEKARVVFRSNYDAFTFGGVSFASAYYDSANVSAYYGCRLAFKTKELADYAGKQFVEIYADLNFKGN